jgi:hypothetical protein
MDENPNEDLCDHIVAGEYPGPYTYCQNPKRERPDGWAWSRVSSKLAVKYCDEHGSGFTDHYADVYEDYEGAQMDVSTFYFSNQEGPKFRAYVASYEAQAHEDLNAMPLDKLAEHLVNGGQKLEASYHEHEFDSREEYEEWIENSMDCFCQSYETLFDAEKEYGERLAFVND